MSRTVVLLGTVSLLTDVSSEATVAVLPLYLTLGLGLSPLAYGVVDGVYQGASVVVRVAGGWVADRSDRPKSVAVVGYAISAVARIAFLTAGGLGAVTAWLGVDRLGKGLRTGPRDAMIAASSESGDLGRAYGVHRAMDTAGAVLGPVLAFVVLAAAPGDYSAVFVLSCAAALIGLAVLVLLVPDVRPRQRTAIAPAQPSLRLLREPRMARLIAAAGLLGLLTIGDGFVYLALQRRTDLALEFFPLLFVGTGVAYLVLSVPLGRLADRIGRGRLMVGGHVFLLAAYGWLALAPAEPWGGALLVVPCLLLLGAFYAATDGVLAAAAAALAPAGAAATAIATAQSAVAAARMVAAVAFGSLWVLMGSERALGLVAVGLLVAMVVARRLVSSAPGGSGGPA